MNGKSRVLASAICKKLGFEAGVRYEKDGSYAVLVKRGDSVEVGNVNSIGQRASKPKITKIA
jgi:hypothetical protein